MPGPKCLCVGQKLHPKPPPSQLSAEAVRPSPPHTMQYPDLTSSSHLPAPPSSSLSSVRFVSFWAGGGE